MNKTKKLVASISTLITRRTYYPSSTFRCNPLATIAINSQTHLSRESLQPSFFDKPSSSAKTLTISVSGLRFSGRGFCSGSCDKRSSVCWNCGFSSEIAAFLFCDACRSIQPVDDSVDYFQIFGLEIDSKIYTFSWIQELINAKVETFELGLDSITCLHWERKYDLDAGSLESKYKDWQKKLHPDLVHNKSQKERDYAAEQSAKVTEACRTLTKRLSRAMYIMKLNDIHVNEEETITDPTLLMEIMELREAIAEASDSKALNQIRSQVQEKLKQWSDSFVEAFESQRFGEAIKCIQRMTYYERACEEIVKKL